VRVAVAYAVSVSLAEQMLRTGVDSQSIGTPAF